MNALIKKEIRLILPAWIAAMLMVAVLPAILQTLSLNNVPYNPDFLPIPFGLGILFLSVASFGQEFSFKTFSLLLSQPVPRRRIWLVKIAILAVAFVSVLLALFVCYKIYFYLRPVYNIPFPIDILTIYGLVILSGGLWATLLLRQMTGAFWFAILVPAFLMLVLFEFSEHFHWSQHTDTYGIMTIFLFYPIAGFLWAWKMFLRAQDTQWAGGEISFSWRRKSLEQTAASFSSHPRHWLSALVRKEFQLHQTTIVIASVVLALHLASVFIRKIHPHFTNTAYKDILEMIWSLWLLMPLVIGSAAVAEERRLGVIESQLCLPVSRRAQLSVKFSVALALSLFLGVVMPMLIERTNDLEHAFKPIFIIAATTFFISFYASTLARTMIQAIGIAIGFSAAIYLYELVTATGFRISGLLFSREGEQFGLELLKDFLSVSILLLVLARLSFGNFKWLHENWKLWRRNLIAVVVSLAFAFLLANGIYFRAWESLSPIEPPHGQARLNDSSDVKFASKGNLVSAILPDGRLWIETIAIEHYTNRADVLLPDQSKAQFIGGSNWMEVTPHWYETLAIQSNGTLWNLQSKWDEARGWIPSALTQMGLETNWSHIANGDNEYFYLLLKNDGSLWLWGTNRVKGGLAKKLAADLATTPARIGEGTNWTGLLSLDSAYAKKNDGSIWTWRLQWKETNSISRFTQETNLDDNWLNYHAGWSVSAVVKTNGELWLLSDTPVKWNPNDGRPSYLKQIQLGQNARWKMVTFSQNFSLVALRSDGTLWKWSSYWNANFIKPVQLGNRSDWIAISRINGWLIIALAADGSLWAWDEPSDHMWLAPSRRPVLVGNIFQGANPKAE
jgi:ABC-type transport system involved in multi-copper enzyme maturation permease subunit